MKRILGFDISSSCIGWCILEINEDNSIKFIKCDNLKPSKKGSILDKLLDTKSKIQKIIEEEKPDYIGIEDLIKFMPKSTATTVVTLASFNRMIGLISYEYLKDHPGLFNVMSIRHALKLNKNLPKKEEMPELVSKHLGIKFPYIKDKKGKIKPESFDMADGVAVALYYSFILTNRIKIKK